MESVCRIGDFFLCRLVPRPVYLLEISAVCKIERRRYVYYIKQREGCSYRYLMLPAVTPVLDKIGVHELVLFRIDGVGDMSCIAHVNLLIPPLLSCSILALERIEA